MRRVLVLAFMLAMVTVLAAPVTAKPPTDPKKPPHSTQQDGVTCLEAADDFAHPPVAWDADSGPLIITLTPKASIACIDVASSIAADYRVKIVRHRNLRTAAAWVKDSQPGDVCHHYSEIELPAGLTMPGIPASEVDACGVEWTDDDPALVFAVSAAFSRGPSGWVEVQITRLDP
jgi:hypothetical protein